ncbi:MAG: M20/M25/M40 family metallo-hydrolase [Actinomycetota bacterium]
MNDHDVIRAAVAARARRFVDTHKQACSIPSISAEGQGLEEMASWLEARLSALGATVTKLDVPGAPPAVLADFEGANGDRALMVYDHYDVQPTDPIDLWETPPFHPDERNGRIYARGAADNKGDLSARLCALETFLDIHGGFPYRVKCLIEGEEENGSFHFEELCRAHGGLLKADDCVWEGAWYEHDGRPQVIYGCKGLLYVDLRVRLLTGDQHSSQAVYAPSAAWDLLQAIASLRDDRGRVAIEGFYDDVADPDEEERKLIAGLSFDEEAERARLGVDRFVDGLTGDSLKHALIYAPTANVAGFHTGYGVRGATKTVLPAEALAKLDFRLVPRQDADDIVAKLRRHLDRHGFQHIEMSVLGHENPSRSPRSGRLGRAVEAAAASWFPKPLSIWPLMIATGPMHPIAHDLEIPICDPPGVTRPDSNIHAPNENVRIEDFLDIVGFTVAYLEAYADSE